MNDTALFKNNFDLIRLFAAAEVMVFHLYKYQSTPPEFMKFIDAILPGVPIFFFISGFLISHSYDRNWNLKTYSISRALRIFPALYACLLFSCLMLVILYRPLTPVPANTIAAWLIAQATIFQSWNPEFFRAYGTGVVNASLWTIAVELLFYISVPIVFFLSRYVPRMVLYIFMLGTSLTIYSYTKFVILPEMGPDVGLYKVLSFSPAAIASYLWMFTLGMMAQYLRKALVPLVAGKFFHLLALYLVTGFAAYYILPVPAIFHVGPFGVINYTLLCLLILSAAYSAPTLAARTLGGNDISYGLYLFHLPIMNALIMMGWTGGGAIAANVVLAILAASASWVFIERPAMKLRMKLRNPAPTTRSRTAAATP